MTKAPCKDCPDRESSCHVKCVKYQEFRRERDKYLELKNKIVEEERAKMTRRKVGRR